MPKAKAPAAQFLDVAVIAPDDERARAILEKLRWPNGPRCVKCGSLDVYKIASGAESQARPGLYRCRDCEGQFTVTVGTIFEDSHVPLGKWLVAIHLMAASKKGISSHQLHRMLKVTYKTAWFMTHRIRYALTQEPLAGMLKGTVEVDETFVGGLPKNRHVGKREPAPPKIPVLSLVERNGRVRSFAVESVTGATLKTAIRANVRRSAKIMTDGNLAYHGLDKEFAKHESVNHQANEYVRGNAHTNTVEGYFSLLKRGLIGTFHHVSREHLWRYLAEFDARWNARKISDAERAERFVKATEGRRLTYKPLVQHRTNG
jgi:transposase-like protein